MRTTLIQCSTGLTKELMPPLGLLALASSLRAQGRHAEVRDLSMEADVHRSLDQLLAGMDRNEQQVIGFNMNTHTRFLVRDLIARTRTVSPDALICAGGPHPTLDAEDTLRHCRGLDFVVRGEGEATMNDALGRLGENFQVESLRGVAGISLRFDDEVLHNEARSRITELDSLPIPDRDLVDIRSYHFSFPVKDPDLQVSLNPTTVLTSRGCPYGCIFCSVADQWGRRTTFFSEDRVMEELTLIKEKYGFNAVYFFDDTFTLKRDRVESLCRRMIREKLGLVWFAEVRANTVDEELLTLMHAAGLRSAAMGVESASPRILTEIIHKGIDLKQAQEAIRVFKRLGVYCKAFFTYSYPSETLEDVHKTLDFARRVVPDRAAFGRLKLYPGTPLFALAQQQGKVVDDFSWFDRLPEYDAFMSQANVPLYRDRLSEQECLHIAHAVNTLDAELSGRGHPLLLKLKGLALNLARVRRPKDLVVIFRKILLHIVPRRPL